MAFKPIRSVVPLALVALSTSSNARVQPPIAAAAQVQSAAPQAMAVGQWEGEAQPAKGWPLFLLLHLGAAGGSSGTLFVLG